MESVQSKLYLNRTKIFVLRLFKMVANLAEFSRLEKRSFIKYLVGEKCKLCGICRRMSEV